MAPSRRQDSSHAPAGKPASRDPRGRTSAVGSNPVSPGTSQRHRSMLRRTPASRSVAQPVFRNNLVYRDRDPGLALTKSLQRQFRGRNGLFKSQNRVLGSRIRKPFYRFAWSDPNRNSAASRPSVIVNRSGAEIRCGPEPVLRYASARRVGCLPDRPCDQGLSSTIRLVESSPLT